MKNGEYCNRRRVKGKLTHEPISPQPQEEEILVLRRNYSVSKTDQSFKRRVSVFQSQTNGTISNVAIYEYQGKQPQNSVPHGSSKTEGRFVRTNPKTLDKIKEKNKHQKPREIYHDLKKDNSMTCARDYEVIRNKKYNDKKKENPTLSRGNVADEILDVFRMLNSHPFVQTIIQHKNSVPSIICYTSDQITDLKHFLSQRRDQPLGIDRTFNLGSFYVTTIVYKNQRVI